VVIDDDDDGAGDSDSIAKAVLRVKRCTALHYTTLHHTTSLYRTVPVTPSVFRVKVIRRDGVLCGTAKRVPRRPGVCCVSSGRQQ
jgi:hypothetical protein